MANYGANALYENTGDGNFKKVETGAIVTDSADSISMSAAWGTHRTRWWFVCGGDGGGAGGSGGGNGD